MADILAVALANKDRSLTGDEKPQVIVTVSLETLRHRHQPNPGAGYRTYSRNTISSERVGNWRVELRSADGAVLHEERFTVR